LGRSPVKQPEDYSVRLVFRTQGQSRAKIRA
jgi:hypothetical protein